MKHSTIGARTLAALLTLTCAAGLALPAVADVPDALINAALLSEKQSYHVDLTETNGAKSIRGTGDIQSYSPLKMHMAMNMGPQGSMEMIVIGPNSYMKMGGAAWRKFPADPGASSNMMVADFAKDRANYSATDLGMQTKDGQVMHAYSLVNTQHKTTQTVFLDSAGRLTRLEMPNMVMRLTNFGENVNIAAPM